MPVQRCTENGKSGYRWGSKGKCYTGPDAKQKAAKQGRAIETNKSKGLLIRFMEMFNSKQTHE